MGVLMSRRNNLVARDSNDPRYCNVTKKVKYRSADSPHSKARLQGRIYSTTQNNVQRLGKKYNYER